MAPESSRERDGGVCKPEHPEAWPHTVFLQEPGTQQKLLLEMPVSCFHPNMKKKRPGREKTTFKIPCVQGSRLKL
jgi:hypothetical protein